jgi:3-methyladenine DNA glycosylase AlkC
MATQECTEGVTLEELLNRPTDLLVLVGAEDDPDADADSDDEGDEEEDDDDDADADDDDEEDDDDPDGKSKKNKKLGEKDQQIADLTAEVARHKKRRAAGEERITRLVEENRQLKANGSSDDELKKTNTEVTEERDALKVDNSKLVVENAFLKSNTISWKDPEAALKLADLSDVTFEDGHADGLAAALRKLAKEKPYLVADKPGSKTVTRKTGDKPAPKGRRTEAQKQAEEKKLLDRYPALRK